MLAIVTPNVVWILSKNYMYFNYLDKQNQSRNKKPMSFFGEISMGLELYFIRNTIGKLI